MRGVTRPFLERQRYWYCVLAVAVGCLVAFEAILLGMGTPVLPHPEVLVPQAHQKVRGATGEGEITSGGFAPTLGRSIALARLPAGAAPGSTAQVDVRGRALEARVVRPPFVRLGKSLVPDF